MTLSEKLAKIDELNKKIEMLEEEKESATDDFLENLCYKLRNIDIPKDDMSKYSAKMYGNYNTMVNQDAIATYREAVSNINQVLNVVQMYPEDFWVEIGEDEVCLGGEGCFYHEWERGSASFPKEWISKSSDELNAMFKDMKQAAELEKEEVENQLKKLKEDADRRTYEKLKARFEGEK